jgi:hypothetical protein
MSTRFLTGSSEVAVRIAKALGMTGLLPGIASFALTVDAAEWIKVSVSFYPTAQNLEGLVDELESMNLRVGEFRYIDSDGMPSERGESAEVGEAT